ncbi:PP2C family protein-serine/threonine phosphatase [Pseudomonas syringae]|uniref:PP2C family protein-serine/threonine phosphatase n=1 Tax=Pseudomonas syringae TaxID=317 RepID=UPI0004648787|nr:protein phosphatase 2C domain-containing protein [Pseudomonas syringae]
MINLLSSSTFSFPKEDGRQNEDAIFPPLRVGDGFLIAVADGVGSYEGASQASQAAIEVLAAIPVSSWGRGVSGDEIFAQIKRRVIELSAISSTYSDAATTLTFCYINNFGIRVGHVGDCRAYIRKEGGLTQLTTDHTQHQKLIDEGLYKPSELKRLGGKNTLFSAISKKVDLFFQDSFLTYDQLMLKDKTFEILIMSDGAYHFWDLRPRFVLSTLQEPSRFASSLHRRITRFSPVDDYSLIAAKFQLDH